MEIVHLIQSAVAPVFLLSGVGVTLGVLTNRLARIIDRIGFQYSQFYVQIDLRFIFPHLIFVCKKSPLDPVGACAT